jgi:hypothetical protein
VDDDGLNLARVPENGAPAAGAVLVAGTPTAWSWAVVEDVADDWVRFRLTAAPEFSYQDRITLVCRTQRPPEFGSKG